MSLKLREISPALFKGHKNLQQLSNCSYNKIILSPKKQRFVVCCIIFVILLNLALAP